MFSRKSFSVKAFKPLSWRLIPDDEETPRQAAYPGACFPFGSTSELIRLRRKKKRRDADLLLLGI